MKERPILFSAPMVRAILSGAKTQTRRVMKPQQWVPEDHGDGWWPRVDGKYLACPYGVPGDRLWVREAWAAFTSPDHWTGECDEVDVSPHEMRTEFMHVDKKDVVYAADGKSMPQRWRPSIHMPRWASRITLAVTGVRVERLQDIREADAKVEGCDRAHCDPEDAEYECMPGADIGCGDGYTSPRSYVMGFAKLWDSINGADQAKAWCANPYVWVVEFRRVTP